MNNELKLNVDEQQDGIKHLKDYCDIDHIELIRKEMDVCVTCNHNFKEKLVERNIKEKHNFGVGHLNPDLRLKPTLV